MNTKLALLSLAISLVSFPCLAHMEPGQYSGKTAAGQPCTFKVKEVTFAYDLEHPLNERVTIELADGTPVVLSHPPRVDAEQGNVGFDHDHLSGARGVTNGALAVIVDMNHAAGHHGPAQMMVVRQVAHEIDDANNSNTSGKDLCLDLRHDD